MLCPIAVSLPSRFKGIVQDILDGEFAWNTQTPMANTPNAHPKGKHQHCTMLFCNRLPFICSCWLCGSDDYWFCYFIHHRLCYHILVQWVSETVDPICISYLLLLLMLNHCTGMIERVWYNGILYFFSIFTVNLISLVFTLVGTIVWSLTYLEPHSLKGSNRKLKGILSSFCSHSDFCY